MVKQWWIFNRFNIINSSRNLYKEFYEYLNGCPRYMIIDKFILVYAGTGLLRYENFNAIEFSERLDNLHSETLLWDRRFYDRAFNKNFYQSLPNFTIIIGHTPIQNNKKYAGKINKDLIIKNYLKNNSTVISLDLGVLCLESRNFYYIEND